MHSNGTSIKANKGNEKQGYWCLSEGLNGPWARAVARIQKLHQANWFSITAGRHAFRELAAWSTTTCVNESMQMALLPARPPPQSSQACNLRGIWNLGFILMKIMEEMVSAFGHATGVSVETWLLCNFFSSQGRWWGGYTGTGGSLRKPRVTRLLQGKTSVSGSTLPISRLWASS